MTIGVFDKKSHKTASSTNDPMRQTYAQRFSNTYGRSRSHIQAFAHFCLTATRQACSLTNFQFHSYHDGAQLKATRILLTRLGLSPQRHMLQHFHASSVVYIRLSMDRRFFAVRYIGRAAQNMQSHEASRNRKHRQAQDNKLVHAELAIRWWHKHNNYHLFILFTVQHSIPPEQLEAVEATPVQNAQAQSPPHRTVDEEVTQTHSQAGQKQSNRVQKHLGQNTQEASSTQHERHLPVFHLHNPDPNMGSTARPFNNHQAQIRSDTAASPKFNQQHIHVRTVQDGTQHAKHPQAERHKGNTCGHEEAPACQATTQQPIYHHATFTPHL